MRNVQDTEIWSRPVDPSVSRRKVRLAAALDRAGVLERLLDRLARRGPYVRGVNYHHVPASRAESFEQQLRWFASRFVGVGPKELGDLQAGHWPHAKPGILLSFDDACRTHAEVVAPLLEKHGFTGWFFVPSAFCDVPEPEQRNWARDHAISAWAPLDDPRLGMRWDQVRELSLRHVIGSHTRDHVRLAERLGEAELRQQVADDKRRLERETGQPVQAFAWVGGEEWSYSVEGVRAVADAGFRFAFGTNCAPFRPGDDPLRIERTNLEAGYPLSLVRFQISGLMDRVYARKRDRLAERLAAA
jgi:peptidoglycan/xylan/chitin deacetylase (PgdA/CDA1 family)